MLVTELRVVYAGGVGGRHRRNAQAARWRELTTHIAANYLRAFPLASRVVALATAEYQAIIITYDINDRIERGLPVTV
jgi:hypothetical protein